jgi:DNA-binding IclR family transcriptional regulator
MAITLERGLKILGSFRATDDGPLSNRELAVRSGLPKATVSRLTYTLTKLDFLLHTPQRGYSLGPGVLGPAYVFYARLNIRQISRPYLRRLATRPAVYLSIGTRQDLRIISLESATADWPAPLAGLFNAQAAIERSAAGHAYLAGLPSSDRQLLIDRIQAHHDPQKGEWATIAAHIERDVQAVSVHGYCIVMGEWHASVNAVAAPIRVPARQLYLVLSAGGPAQLLPREELDALGTSLREAAQEIERQAGNHEIPQD